MRKLPMPMLGLTAAILAFPAFAAEPDTIEAAIQRMYDFNFPASHEILSRYIAAHPQDPLPYAFRASAYLFYELDRMSILESDFFLDDNRIAEKKKKLEPDPTVRQNFLKAVRDTESRTQAALKTNPEDRQALFAMCIAQGASTDYMAFVEKRQIASLSVAKSSNSHAQQLMKLDPKWAKPTGHAFAFAFRCADAKDVNDTYARLTKAGYRGKTAPFDAFWGQRYATVLDPDDNAVDLFAELKQ